MSKEFQIQMVSLNRNMIDQISNEITVLTKKVNNLTQSHGYNVDTAKRGGGHFFIPRESTISRE